MVAYHHSLLYSTDFPLFLPYAYLSNNTWPLLTPFEGVIIIMYSLESFNVEYIAYHPHLLNHTGFDFSLFCFHISTIMHGPR
jgi:hypothetical protein